MYLDRLQKAIDTLKEVHEKEIPFDIGNWYYDTECGTSACALGHISIQKWANDLGLCKNTVTHVPTYINPETTETTNMYNAAVEFFGITHDQALWLFSPTLYSNYTGANSEITILGSMSVDKPEVTANDVATRIKWLIEGKDIPAEDLEFLL